MFDDQAITLINLTLLCQLLRFQQRLMSMTNNIKIDESCKTNSYFIINEFNLFLIKYFKQNRINVHHHQHGKYVYSSFKDSCLHMNKFSNKRIEK